MRAHYQVGSGCQDSPNYQVTPFQRYPIGMSGELIKGLRARTDLSMKEFGKVVSYSDKQISNFENEKSPIPDSGAIKIARRLNERYGWSITPFDVSPEFMALYLEALDAAQRPFHIEAYKRSFLSPAPPAADELRIDAQGLDKGKRPSRKSRTARA